MSQAPSLRRERQLLREISADKTAGDTALIAGIDEVGRGALAGPVTVGVVVVSMATKSAPVGLRDSKLLTPRRREELVPALQKWGVARGVGHASNREIDALGISAALALAALRALEQFSAAPDLILLDGHHDWLSPPQDLFAELRSDGDPLDVLARKREQVLPHRPPVHTVKGGDMSCASIAAASVLAKVERDAIMMELAADPAHADYGWDSNKGYGAARHLAALREQGACDHHRQSWDLVRAPEGVRCGAPSAQNLDTWAMMDQ